MAIAPEIPHMITVITKTKVARSSVIFMGNIVAA